jgi:hypothetical protein
LNDDVDDTDAGADDSDDDATPTPKAQQKGLWIDGGKPVRVMRRV